MKHTICMITGTRAEWGLLRSVYREIQAHPMLDVKVVVTGAHLDPQFGNTVQEVAKDADIDAQIEILDSGTATKEAILQNTSLALSRFGEYFAKEKPDAVLVLGDRYEIFAAGTAAAMLCIPLIHISGGDVTYGAIDDWFRHCLTKMASLHFPACEEYAQRVIAMGEQPSRVVNVGGLGDENIRKLPLLSREELAQNIQFDLSKSYFLVTYHPETATHISPLEQFEILQTVLQEREESIIFTKANADAGGAQINKQIDIFCKANANRAISFESMGVVRYLSAMKFCKAVIGNSSSGVVETPTFGIPTVNIGQRQAGRIICDNVICCDCNVNDLRKAIYTVCQNSFQEKAHKTVSPYSGGDTAHRIAMRIADFFAEPNYRQPKHFYDVKQAMEAEEHCF